MKRCESPGAESHRELQQALHFGGPQSCPVAVRQESTPLLERLQFVAIASRNVDEFFAKRVGGLMRQVAAGATNLKVPCALPQQPPHTAVHCVTCIPHATHLPI